MRNPLNKPLTGSAIIFAVLLFSPGTFAQPAARQVLPKRLPEAALDAKPIGALPETDRLSLAIGLPLRNQAALQTFLQQLYDPASTNYHHYLTTEQFTEKFGPTEKDYRTVRAFAKANHLEVTAENRNRVLLEVSGTVADIERVFHTTLRTYQHPTEARAFYAPDAAPSLNLDVPILSVGGLNNFSLARPRLQHVSPVGQNAGANSGAGPGGTYRGSDFRAAYVPDSKLTGSGQTVGLLEFDGYTSSDITYYETQAGLPNVPLSNVLLAGATGLPSGTGGEVEVSLDIEVAISLAPNMSQTIVYEAPNNGTPFEVILNRMVSDNVAKQLSCSWFVPDGGADPTADGIFQEMAAQGQSFFNASGDDDAYTGLIDFPGDNPHITQVGGTTLTTSGPAGARTAEQVWNWGNGIGSGGGVSTQYPIPTYQTNINMSANQGSTTMRNTPDVAMVADNVYVRVDGQDVSVGGTSCAAPLWAGFAALVNEEAVSSGHPTIGFINPAVDAIGSGASYSSCFFDITIGNNTSPNSPSKFYAVAGYDLCTGWGTPAGQNLIDALANPESLEITPDSGFSSEGGVGGPFTVTSQELYLTNSGTNVLTWTLANPVPWLDAAPTGGALNPGQAPTIVTVSLNAAASNLVVGTYTGTLWFTNLNDTNSISRTYSVSIIPPPTITSQPSDQAVLDGATAQFFVAATGGLPLFYQWQLNGTNLTDGGNISGSTTTNLIVNNASLNDVGAYDVVVTNIAGTATSSNASLTITPSAPVITVQPASQTVVAGKTATFSVAAIGTKPFDYQWSYGGPEGTNIDNATNATLSLPNVQLTQSGLYSVTISNSLGFVASSNAVLDVVLVPAIADFSPLSGNPGANATIDGLNFSTIPGDNVVYFGAVQAVVTSQSLTNLTVIVPTNATFAPISVTVGGLTAYADQPFLPTFPGLGPVTNSSFAPSFNLNTEGGPNRMLIADLDGDGKPDLIVGDTDAGVVAIYQNISTNGSLNASSFGSPVNLLMQPGGGSIDPFTIAVADLDGDGRLDIIGLDAQHNIVSIFRNISSPGTLTTNSFATRIDLPAGNAMRGVAVQDLDGDGLPEIVVGNQNDNNISIFKNMSAIGSIAFAPRVNLPAGNGATTVVIGDLDGDGLPDIAVANYNDATVSVFRNLGFTGTITTNSFAPALNFAAPATPYGLALGDMDGDGKLDIVVGGAGESSTIAVLRNTATPGTITSNSFAPAVNFAAPGWVNFVALADLDGDGKPDIALVTQLGNAFSVFKNISTPGSFTTGSLAPRLDFPAGSNPNGIAVGDLNGDGRPDVVFANFYDNTLSIYQNVVPFIGTPAITSQPTNQVANVGDTVSFSVTASGNQPLSYQWYFDETTAIPGATNSALTLTNVQLDNGGVYSVTVMNALGSVTSSGASLSVIPPRGQIPVITSFNPLAVDVGMDVTIDGSNFNATASNDIVYFGAVQALVTSASTSNLTVIVPTNATFAPISVTVDGLTAFSDQPFLPTFPGLGPITNSSFAPAFNLNTQGGPERVLIADLDGDGKPDLIVSDTEAGVVAIYQNISTNGSLNAASFGPPVNLLMQPRGGSIDPFTIAVADLDGDGRLDIIGLDAQNNVVSIFRNISSPGTLTTNSFATRVDLPAGNAMRGVAVQDLDGDGRPEIVVGNENDNNISIFKNNSTVGTIAFAPRVNLPAGNGATTIAIGDIDGDGLPDIAVANYNDATVSVFRNLGFTGTITTNSFAPAVNFAVPATPFGLALGDMDGDGKLDMVVGGAGGSSTIAVLRNTSTVGSITSTSFAPAVNFAAPGWVNFLALADLDGSGKPDIALVTQSGNAFSVFKNISTPGSFTTGSLAPRLDFPAGSNPNGIAIGDLNGDGRPDVVFANFYDNTLSIYQNVVPFAGVPVITSQPVNVTVPAGDTATFTVGASGFVPLSYQWFFGLTNIINGATNSTLVLTNVQPANAGLYSVTVSNSFGSATSSNAVLTVFVPASNNAPVITGFSPISADVDVDITINGSNFNATASNDIVYFGAVQALVTSASASNLTVIVPTNATFAPISVTVNGLTAFSDQPFLPTFPGVGPITNSSFAPAFNFNTQAGPERVLIADLDGDGKSDLIVGDTEAGVVAIYQNISTNGSLNAASFGPPVNLLMQPGGGSIDPFTIAVADLDGDGRLDIIGLDAQNNVVSIFRNISSPGTLTTNSFASRVDLPAGNAMRGVAVQDLDGDGRPEIVVGNENDNNISIFKNNSTVGTIAFAPRVNLPAGNGATTVVIGDLDGDGLPDIAVANYNDATVSVFRNLGFTGTITTNSFAPAVNFAVPATPFGLALGDMDGDGKLDMVVGGAGGSSTIAVLRNTSTVGSITTTSFAPAVNFAAPGWVNFLALADLDGSGKPDIALVTQSGNAFSVFKNISTPGSFTTGSLAPRLDFPAGSNPNGIAIGDLNGDGRPDVVFANFYDNTLSIYRNILTTRVPPTITGQPTNETAAAAGNVTFSVTATGVSPLGYQWNFNGTNAIPGATNSTLILSNLQVANDGNYSVTVTNPYGSVTSSNALLTVVEDHFAWTQIPTPRFVNAPFTVTIEAQDATNGLFTNFTGFVSINSTNGVVVQPIASADFTNGIWTGTLEISQPAANVVLDAFDGNHAGFSNPFDVVNPPSLTLLNFGTSILISWPISPSGFVLESSGTLLPGSWAPVSGSPLQFNGQNLQSVPMTGSNQFFRLQYSGP